MKTSPPQRPARRRAPWPALAAASCVLSTSTFAAEEALVARPGDMISGKTLVSTYMPTSNARGQVAFHASYMEEGQLKQGLFAPDRILVEPGTIIDGKEILNPQLSSDGLNDAGMLAFFAWSRDVVTGEDHRHVFLLDLDTDEASLLIEAGDVVAGATVTGFDGAVLNDSGVLVILTNASGPAGSGWQLIAIDLVSGEEWIAMPPGYSLGGRVVTSVAEIGFNDAGTLLVKVWLNGSTGAIIEIRPPLLEDGDSVDGATVTYLGCPSLNDAGESIIWVELDGPISSGIVKGGELLVRAGDVIDGHTLQFVGCGSLNDAGDVVFEADLDVGSGVFQIGPGGTSAVVVPGDVISGKTITRAISPTMNDQSQIVFLGWYEEDGIPRQSVFATDRILIAPGEVIGDKEIVWTIVYADGLNDSGLLAVDVSEVDLTTGAHGSAVYTVDLTTGERTRVIGTGDIVAGNTLDQVFHVTLNDEGLLVFDASSAEASSSQVYSYHLQTGVGSVVVPAGYSIGGRFIQGVSELALNDSGTVLLKTTDQTSRGSILQLPRILHEQGDIIDGVITFPGCPSLNDLGDHIFWSNFTGSGIFGGGMRLIKEGDIVAGKALEFVGCGSLNNAGDIVFEGSFTENGLWNDGIFLLPGRDDDADGVSDSVEDNAPNNGDGNGDGIPDSEQENVASLPNSEDQQFVTLASPPGSILENVVAADNPSPADAPAQAEFPVGFLDFSVRSETAGGTTTVEIFIPPGTEVNQYWKYGPEPGSPEPHWYLFAYDGTTGAEFLADRIVLHFVDGDRGDSDLEANGLVVDPGAPAFSPDADGDGIPNDQDCCPNSDLRPSIWINGVNTEVANESLGDGCTLADVITKTLTADPATADVVALLLEWKDQGYISGREMGRILKEFQ